MRILLTLACAGAVVQQLTRGFAATLDPNLAAWLAVQTNVVSWSADFLQTRSLKSLTRPLTATGRVWFAAPNRFRWELGHPPQTIAVRDDREMRLIYPRLKRVERFPLNTQGPWRDALALLEAGFPRSQVQLEHQYTLLSQKLSDETCVLSLRPKSPEARRMMPQITIEFDRQKLLLLATELHLADGSVMRNDFKNAVLNPPIEDLKFSPEIPSDYEVVEPLKSR